MLLIAAGRLVDCSRLKKGISQVYETFLLKKTFPFVVLKLVLPGESVDVNVHPTKREVFFLNEESIVAECCMAIEQVLKGANFSVAFSVPVRDGSFFP